MIDAGVGESIFEPLIPATYTQNPGPYMRLLSSMQGDLSYAALECAGVRGHQPHMSALDSIGFGGATSRPKIPLEQVTRGRPDATPPRARCDREQVTQRHERHVPIFCDSVFLLAQTSGDLNNAPRTFPNAFSPWGSGRAPQGELALAWTTGRLGQGNETCRRRFVLS